MKQNIYWFMVTDPSRSFKFQDYTKYDNVTLSVDKWSQSALKKLECIFSVPIPWQAMIVKTCRSQSATAHQNGKWHTCTSLGFHFFFTLIRVKKYTSFSCQNGPMRSNFSFPLKTNASILLENFQFSFKGQIY